MKRSPRQRQPAAPLRAKSAAVVAEDVPRIILDADLCKKCGICVAICPADVYRPDRDGFPLIAQPDRCIWCERCETYCPDYAIRLEGWRGW